MEINDFLTFTVLTFIAEIIGTLSGFGSSVLFVPIASMFFDISSVLAVTALFHVFSNISKIFLFRQGTDKILIKKLGIPAVIFVVIGAWLTGIFNPAKLDLIIHICLIFMVIYLLIYHKKVIEKTDRNIYMGGIASGFLAGFTGTGGAIRGITMAAFNLEKSVFIATSAYIDFFVDISRTAVYFFNGFIHNEHWLLVPLLIGVSFAGTYCGKLLLKNFSQEKFKLFALTVVLITSIAHIFMNL